MENFQLSMWTLCCCFFAQLYLNICLRFVFVKIFNSNNSLFTKQEKSVLKSYLHCVGECVWVSLQMREIQFQIIMRVCWCKGAKYRVILCFTLTIFALVCCCFYCSNKVCHCLLWFRFFYSFSLCFKNCWYYLIMSYLEV